MCLKWESNIPTSRQNPRPAQKTTSWWTKLHLQSSMPQLRKHDPSLAELASIPPTPARAALPRQHKHPSHAGMCSQAPAPSCMTAAPYSSSLQLIPPQLVDAPAEGLHAAVISVHPGSSAGVWAQGSHLRPVLPPSSVIQTAVRRARKNKPDTQHQSQGQLLSQESQRQGSGSLLSVKYREDRLTPCPLSTA